MNFYSKLFGVAFCVVLHAASCANADLNEENAQSEELKRSVHANTSTFSLPAYTNEIAAIVNGEVITMEHVRMEVAPMMQQIQLKSKNEDEFRQNIAVAELEAVNGIINRKLIVNSFLEKGIQLSDLYEKKEYENYLSEAFDGNRLEFVKYLKEYGKSVREFKKDVKERMILGFMSHELLAYQTEVSPNKIKEYYNFHLAEFFKDREIDLKQIVVLKDNSSDSSLKLKKIDEALANGNEFFNVAETYSDSIATYDIGYICPSDLLKEIADVVSATAIGTYTPHIELSNATCIFFLQQEKPAKQFTLEEVSQSIENKLTLKYKREARMRWIQKLRDSAYIKIYIGTNN